jgi:two-component system, OmpR family, response regulator ChvI
MNEAVQLVVVDDDELFRPMLAGNLTAAGFGVRDFPGPQAAMDMLCGEEEPGRPPVDLLILDWKMPGLTGLELLQHLRAEGISCPAVFLTSLDDVIYEEAALKAGAVDFIGKTRSFAVLERRIALALERAAAVPADRTLEPEKPLSLGRLELNAASHAVSWGGQTVALTLGEFKAVALLAGAGRDVGYREIYDSLKGENFVAGQGPEGYRANVRALIKRVRQKFIGVDPAFDAIENFPGFGYRWRALDRGA